MRNRTSPSTVCVWRRRMGLLSLVSAEEAVAWFPFGSPRCSDGVSPDSRPHSSQRRERYDLALLDDFDLCSLFMAIASRTSALKADASMCSPSRMSIARLRFPLRLELNRRAGSFKKAPLANVTFTRFL